MINPQTSAPTASAATHDPCHSVRTRLPCSVTGVGRPRRTFSAEHAVAANASVASAAAPVSKRRRAPCALARTGVRRSLRRVGLTDCLPTMKPESRAIRSMFTRVWATLAEGSGHPGGTPVTVVDVAPISAYSSAYFDAASTEPLHPAAREALLTALEDGWADPRRLYGRARRSRLLLEQARTQVAAVLGVRPDETSFTSSGTQAVHLGVLGSLHARRRAGRHLVVSAVEHSSVLHTAGLHERDGGKVTTVGVDRSGRVDPEEFAAALRPDTALA